MVCKSQVFLRGKIRNDWLTLRIFIVFLPSAAKRSRSYMIMESGKVDPPNKYYLLSTIFILLSRNHSLILEERISSSSIDLPHQSSPMFIISIEDTHINPNWSGSSMIASLAKPENIWVFAGGGYTLLDCPICPRHLRVL